MKNEEAVQKIGRGAKQAENLSKFTKLKLLFCDKIVTRSLKTRRQMPFHAKCSYGFDNITENAVTKTISLLYVGKDEVK